MTCLAVAVKAIAQLESVGTVVFFLLIPAVLGGSCLLALVNASWSSRQPGRRCSAVQVACNLILALITMYVEFLFWPYRRHLAFAILCAAALPMFVFINLPSVFMRDRTISSHQRRQRQQQQQDDASQTVMMDDEEHSLFDVADDCLSIHISTDADDEVVFIDNHQPIVPVRDCDDLDASGATVDISSERTRTNGDVDT